MGASNRFDVLAKFIARNFKPCTVADVAGGSGQLSFKLAKLGFKPTIIDPQRNKWSTQHQLKSIRSCFTHQMSEDYELIVGLHPDEASEEICKASVVLKKPSVIVPCCCFWGGHEFRNEDMVGRIERYYARHGKNYWKTALPMTGKNVVVVCK